MPSPAAIMLGPQLDGCSAAELMDFMADALDLLGQYLLDLEHEHSEAEVSSAKDSISNAITKLGG